MTARGGLMAVAVSAALLVWGGVQAEQSPIAAARSGPPVADSPATGFGAAARFGVANDAWARGDYIPALTEYSRILNGPGAAEYFERIALQTGELYQSFELTTDGRNPRFSPDGRFISYESGLEVSRRTRIVRNDASRALVADLPGIGAAFSPASAEIAYLKVADVPEIRAAAQAVEGAALTAGNRGTLVAALAWHVLRNTTIVVHDLATKAEHEVPAPGLLKAGLAYSADGRQLFFVGRPEAQEDGNAIYRVGAAAVPGDPVAMPGPGRFRSAPTVDPSGRVLLCTLTTVDPLRRPPFIQPAVPLVPGRPQEVPANGGASVAGPLGFVVWNLSSGAATVVPGTSPALSSDGGTLAYITRVGTGDLRLMVGPPLGSAAVLETAAPRVDAPALSADGTRVVYQGQVRDDWEIFAAPSPVIARTGEARRLTRDPQHDVLPQFVAGDRVLEAIGEPRHRRSFLIDLETGAHTRLFHNNTLRTIAPEYQWVVSKDGTEVLIVAERDGDTVSPERGVYLMDLTRKVSTADLLRRIDLDLAAERALRDTQAKAFAPIEKAVRAAVADVSVERIYGYERALFGFDSKYISQPGNRLASAFLFGAYQSFGYAPEYQWFSPEGAAGGRTANVVARLPGTTNPEIVYVISSHYDSVAAGPGADDDSSGTAALLEAARVLAKRPQPATIIFASFTGEEAGLLGSREFVRRAVEGKLRVAGALNNDMIGWANDSRLDNTIRYSNPGIRDIQHGAAMFFSRLVTFDARYFKGTDAASYYDAYGDIVGGIGSYPVLSSPHYHQPHDLLEFEDHALIAETSRTTVATIMRLASSPSRIAGLTVDGFADGTATLSWQPSPETGVTSYTISVVAPSQVAPAALMAAARSVTVTAPHVVLRGVVPETMVAVKALNARGLESWDAARVTLAGR